MRWIIGLAVLAAIVYALPRINAWLDERDLSMYKFIVRFIFGCTLVFIVWFNLQPWFEVGRYMAANVTYFPFERVLVRIPVIGGFITAAKNFTVDFFSVLIWLFVQTCQLFGLLANDKALMSAFSDAWGFLPLTVITSGHSKKLKSIAGIAYLLESCVCFMVYPVYGSGISDILADFPKLDPYLLNYGQMILLGITIAVFEIFIWLTCTMWIFMMGKKSAAPTKSAAPDPLGGGRPDSSSFSRS
jgi:hypothetical protein